MISDRPRDDFVPLANGKTALVDCSWADGPRHIVIKARVLIDIGSGFDTVIGEIDGPIDQGDANEHAIVIANNWYDRQNG
jgi:hypothetical protein